MSFPCEWDVDFPIIRRPSVTKPKTTNRITKSVAPTSAIKGSDCSKPVNDTSGKVSITPFTSPEDLALRAVKMKDRENSDAGFTIITLKRKQSLKSGQYPSQQRLRWSKEREKVPSLDALSKGNSQAQVGGALSYTDTSRWSSNSAQDPHDLPVRAFMDEEEEGQFSLCGPIGKLVCQQLQHGNVVRVGTNGNYKGRTVESSERGMPSQTHSPAVRLSEPVPLSITDELERKNAKILAPRSPSVYLSLPIVSETYPVVCHLDHHPHKPFSSPGFHSVEPGEGAYQSPGQTGARKCTVHSTIIRITQAMQEQHFLRGVKQRQWMERDSSQVYPEPAVTARRYGARKVNLRALSANGDIVKSEDLDKLSTQCHSQSLPRAMTVPSFKGPSVPIVAIRQKIISTASVGHVLNGVNPKHSPDSTVRSSDYFRGLLGTTRKKTISYRHQTPVLSQRNLITKQENKMDFLLISKPLKYNHKHISPFVCKQPSTEEQCCPGQTLLPETPVVNTEGVGLYRTSVLSRTNSSSGYKFQNGTLARRGTPIDNLSSDGLETPTEASDSFAPGKEYMESEHEDKDFECVQKSASPFGPQQEISIPTA